MEINLENNEEIIFNIKQNIKCETPSIIAVLLLPISMIFFANSKTGILVGISLLLMILYGIYNIYKLLYGKELHVTSKKIIYKHFDTIKEIHYEKLITIDIKRGFLNYLCDTQTLTLQLQNEKISLVNVSDTQKIKTYLKNKNNKKG